ncbi:MAG TPA: transporter [Longimicrobiales bacterium]|nr:transporter [Longimicrobiales bacterium]
MSLRRSVVLSFVLSLGATPALNAQSMERALRELFIFGDGTSPLFLSGSAGLPSTAVHGDHYIPDASEANGALLVFLNNSIAANVANFPLSATVSSVTFTFVEGVPTPTSSSFGPVFAERAQTLGRGRFDVGVNFSMLSFNKLRGVPLDRLQLNFVHENVDFPNCDVIFTGDCSLAGVPYFENDVLELELDIGLNAQIYAFSAAVGITDWLDVSVAIPVIHFELDGTSTATALVFDTSVVHFFGGSQEAPVLETRARSSHATTGIGDVALRTKLRILHGERLSAALLADVRAPTGRQEDFLGTGEISARGLFIASSRHGDFAPHVNVGYAYRAAELSQDAVELAAGFEQRMGSWATLAVDLLGRFGVEESPVVFPEPYQLEAPFRREVLRTNIPDRRDDILDGSIGFKFSTAGGLVLIANVLVPLNDGGLRSQAIPTLGLQYTH